MGWRQRGVQVAQSQQDPEFVATHTVSPADTDSTQVRVYWSSSPGITTSTPDFITVPRTGFTTAVVIDSGLVEGTTYYYRTSAIGPGGESALSNEVEVVAR